MDGRVLARGTNSMSARCFVDTNILVYAHDAAQGIRYQRARALVEELWKSADAALSTQVLQELCVNLRRKVARPLSVGETRELIEDYSKWDIVVNTAESVLQALDFESRYRISFWDALIVQAATSCGATVLYSEDLTDGQSFGSVRTVNPLK